jgi:hypothetical protein
MTDGERFVMGGDGWRRQKVRDDETKKNKGCCCFSVIFIS